MIGQTLSHYRITAALGAGGMGEVFRATDTKLGREVALKVLPSEMASSPERLERFRGEAQALAALDHPGIVTVYSVEEDDGVHFLTMQLVEGQSLDRLVVEGGMPVEQIIAIAGSLAKAIAAAHKKGIVHRDLKPANVMVTGDGRVKVLDFGLAKMSAPNDGAGSAEPHSQLLTQLQTREGAVMGTVPYMSPEQISGRPLDQRSDLFSFGVLLYEMSTGLRPFVGESSPELASAILRDAPTPPNELRKDLPPGLLRVITRSLEKAPEARYDSAQQLLETLHDDSQDPKQAIEDVTDPPRIAVLPFSNLSGDPEQEYFSDGMAEEVLNALASVSGLRVAARSSAFSFKGQSVDVRTVGQKLDVNHVLEGSVRRAGSRLRINAQLVNAEDGYQLWSQVFDRQMTDIFEVQEEIAQAIVAALRGQFALEPEASLLIQPGTDNLEAYNSYLRGRYQLGTVSPESVRQAIHDLEEAVAADPEFADAWGALAWSWSQLGCWVPFGETAQAMQEAFDRAVALDPVHPAGLASKAWYTVRTSWDWRAAEELYNRCIEDIERDPFALDIYTGGQLLATGRVDRAASLLREALEADPFNLHLGQALAWLLLVDRRAEEALIASDREVAISPNHGFALGCRALALAGTGRLEELPEALERVPDDDDDFFLLMRIESYRALGDAANVERLTERLRDYAKSSPNALCILAWTLLNAGQIEEGLTVLEESVDAGSFFSCFSRTYLRHDPEVWKHPHFQAILQRMRLDDASLREQGFEVEAR